MSVAPHKNLSDVFSYKATNQGHWPGYEFFPFGTLRSLGEIFLTPHSKAALSVRQNNRKMRIFIIKLIAQKRDLSEALIRADCEFLLKFAS